MSQEACVFQVVGLCLATEELAPELVRRLVCSTAYMIVAELYMQEPEDGVEFSVVRHLPRVRHQTGEGQPTRICAVRIVRTDGACIVSIDGFVHKPTRGEWTIAVVTDHSFAFQIVTDVMILISDETEGRFSYHPTMTRVAFV